MLGTQTGAVENSGALVKDTTDASFMADVIEASATVPVIVDFWAPWCGPCKTLGPALEAAVQQAGGKVKMVKIDVDQNQQFASQLQVQSIPAVFAFFDGKPVDAFIGAKTPSEIQEFVKKLSALSGDGGLEEAIEAGLQMLEEGAAVDAAQTFAAILGEEPENSAAYAGLVKANLALGEVEKALAMLANIPESMANDPAIKAVQAQSELAAATAEAGNTTDFRAALKENPADHQARFDLATALLAGNDPAAAIDELLELFRRDRDWNDDAARQQLFKIFDSLGPKDELAQTGRRRLSSMIFL